MKRWNGWGTEGTPYPLPASAGRYLQGIVGKGEAARDARLEDVLEQVPASRLPAHPLVSTEAADRLRHARGQSMPDWVALRSGRIGVYPDGVAYPGSPEEVRALLAYARQTGARLIPYGGGSSVVGHINPLPGDQPVLTVDLGRMNQMESLDEVSGIAVLGARVGCPDLENTVNARGFAWGIGRTPLDTPPGAAGWPRVRWARSVTITAASSSSSWAGRLKPRRAGWNCPWCRPAPPGRT